MPKTYNDDDLDLVRGVSEIARLLKLKKRRAYHLLENKLLPGVKEGRVWVCSKAKLRDFYNGK